MSEPRTDRCPICGADNACAMAAADGAAAACATCWCAAVEIPPAAMENIPARARGRACLCQRCATKLAAAPAEGVRLTRDPGGRPAVELASGEDRALIACDGGQLLSWRTRGHDPLWTASAATYEPAAPVRGGVPIVFPWFGAHPTDPELPAHGFARSREWVVVETAASAVTLALRDDEETRALWPHEFSAELEFELSEALRITMRVANASSTALSFEQAMHTYFAVGDVQAASVHGLEDVAMTEHAREPEAAWDRSAPLRFRAETDRVFQGVPAELSLRAPTLQRELSLQAPAARSTIVWNPWPAKTARLSQMAPDDWRMFCCVETANCKEGAVSLAPGARHELTLTLRVAQR